MRFFIIICLSAFFISGCSTFPIEIDCGLECEEEATPVSQTAQSNPSVQTASEQSDKTQSVEPEELIEEPEIPPQPTMYTSKNWKDYAIELANSINKELVVRGYVGKSVYVKPACSDPHPCDPEVTAFDKAFRDLLITELVRLAVPTVEQHSENSVNVTYKAQIIFHGTKELNFIEKLYKNPRRFQADEVIITTSILFKNKYIFRESGVYTIKDQDFWHYQDLGGEATTIKVAPKEKMMMPPDDLQSQSQQFFKKSSIPLPQNT